MEIITEWGTVFLVMAIIFGGYMAWGIGANDVANAMGTPVGSGAITVKQAIIIAAIFEFAGAFIAGGQVTKTIRKGIIDPNSIAGNPELLIYGMLAAMLAAAIWLMIASTRGWPVSTTHTIIGAIVGFAVVGLGIDAVNWGKIGSIVASWLVSPLIGGTIALLLMISIRKLILNAEKPFEKAKLWGPVYVFLVGWIVGLVTLFKGLKHLKLELTGMQSLVAATVIGIVLAVIGKLLINRVKVDEEADKEYHYASVEKVFVPLMMFTAAAMAFAHGSNDVANAIGPLAAVVSIVREWRRGRTEGQFTNMDSRPRWGRHRHWPGHHGVPGHGDHWHQDHRADADAWLLCDAGGRHYCRACIEDRPAGVDHPDCGGRRHGCGPRARRRRHRSACRWRYYPVLVRHLARGRNSRRIVLFLFKGMFS